MSVLVDTGVWFAKLHERDDHHDEGQAIIASCIAGDRGSVYTTTDVVDEAFALILHRAGSGSRGMARDLGGFLGFTEERPTIATLLETDRRVQEKAWPLFTRHYEDRSLSFTDCTSLVAMRRKGIDAIASFDGGFDGLVDRVAE